MSEIITTIELIDAPPIKGLQFRGFAGEPDFAKMITIIDACKHIDNDDHSETIEDLRIQYANLTNCDPYQDMLFVDLHGDTIGYSRVTWWRVVKTLEYKYSSFFFLLPQHRGKGIEEVMLNWAETRLRSISMANGHGGDRSFASDTFGHMNFKVDLYEKQGYIPERYFHFMKRSLSDVIPERDLPEGIEVRPVTPDQHRKIWAAANEAFLDHWGVNELSEADYQAFIQSRWFQPQLWQVAWEGDEVVGSVQNFIDDLENIEFDRKRGYTEGISVRRPWRKRGIAAALIVRSMRMHKALGMDEVALGVDTESLTGALDLYSNLGYQVFKNIIVFRKPFPAE